MLSANEHQAAPTESLGVVARETRNPSRGADSEDQSRRACDDREQKRDDREQWRTVGVIRALDQPANRPSARRQRHARGEPTHDIATCSHFDVISPPC